MLEYLIDRLIKSIVINFFYVLNMDLKERLLLFIDSLNIEKARFEKEVGLSNGFVDKVSGNIRKSSLNRISNRYPHLNIDWLLTGKGEMLMGVEDVFNPDGSFNEDKAANWLIEQLSETRDMIKELAEERKDQNDIIKHFLKENNELKEEKKKLIEENTRLKKLLDQHGVDAIEITKGGNNPNIKGKVKLANE